MEEEADGVQGGECGGKEEDGGEGPVICKQSDLIKYNFNIIFVCIPK